NGNEISSLMRALQLDPYDASAQTRIAGGEAEAGDWQAAEAALRKAIAVNPRRPAPQIELGRALIEHGQYDEAYAQYRQMATLFPGDADALINLGTLAVRFGHEDEAIASWQRALQADPTRIGVHLLLADALQKQSNPELASAHYEEYFRQVLAHPELRPEPKLLVPILLKFADLNAELRRTNVALMNYESAATIAGKNHMPALEGQAYASAAELQAKAGNMPEAAHSYQQAIAADSASGDQPNQAKDWFNYGQFLRQRRLTRLAYACLLKSGDLFHQGAPSPELQTAAALRQQVEIELGKESAGVRRDLPKALAQATALEPKDFPKAS